MALWVALLSLSVAGPTARAKVVPFYIGTFTDQTTSQGIYRCSLDTDTGKLGTPFLAGKARDPNFLALSPDHRFVFAALDHTVGSFRVQPDGTLDQISEQPAGGAGSCHVSQDETGRELFVANYDGGSVAAFAVNSQGVIGRRTALISFTGSGPNPERQAQSYAHSIYVDPTGKFTYACDLGSDHVWIFRRRAGPSLVSAVPPSATVPPGSGPRHLAFAFHGKIVYVVGEMGLNITTFSRDATSGALTSLGTMSEVPPGTPLKGSTAAEIFCHPSGRWLYVSNRGINILSVLSIASDGNLKLLQSIPAGVNFPRGFAIDPTGRWLVDAGQRDNRLAVFRIDPATGRLTATAEFRSVPSPVDLLFVPKS